MLVSSFHHGRMISYKLVASSENEYSRWRHREEQHIRNWSKLIDLVMRIKLTGVILMTRLWDCWEIRPSIFSCIYIWWHVSWESRFHLSAGHKLEQFRFLHILDRDKLERNLCIVSTIRFLLSNLIYNHEIKFRDLLRNNNKLIR